MSVLRSGWRKLAGSALHKGAKGPFSHHQGAPAAGGILQQAAVIRQFPVLARFMSSNKKLPEFIVVEETTFQKMVKAQSQIPILKLKEKKYLERFHVLASCRAALPLHLGFWDRMMISLKAHFVPTTTREIRMLIYQASSSVLFFGLIALESKSYKQFGGSIDQYAQARRPSIISALFTKERGVVPAPSAAPEEGGAVAAPEEGGAVAAPEAK